ncbi:MAG TPA: DNA gyrase inhibitor YacG [Verrucomicrobia bacterium]|nr:DNA gyrase inhibitor YacG [Verrucomicrobiota bacterium]HOB33509.1 DNA gyrase inhibitor YacG [Verrucomicrobiota bacterium]HOP96283.1 DNA gyrase inhibitor YacG [Verrucomicrobiota bacterium]HPU55646.1 DNA gyrase inhibitor YacG [Verrucomicrobiota bacterium]
MENLKVKCPTCKRVGEWFATEYGPFCSKRCRLIDLGKWLSEEYAISESLHPEHVTQYEDSAGKQPDQTDEEGG